MDNASSRLPSSTFLRKLPAEIRNTIYDLVLVADDRPISITTKDLLQRKALVNTCTQIRSETKDIIVSENSFHVVCGKGGGFVAARWLKSLGEQAQMIKKFSVTFEISEETKEIIQLAANTGAQGYSGAYRHASENEKAHATLCLSFFPETLALARAISRSIKAGRLPASMLDVQKRSYGLFGDRTNYCLRTMSDVCHELGSPEARNRLHLQRKILAGYRHTMRNGLLRQGGLAEVKEDVTV